MFTTHSAMQSYRIRFPEISDSKFIVIENGYDEESFGHAPADAAAQTLPRRLTLVHSGLLYQTGRDPSCFLQAVARLKQQGTLDAGQLRVILRAPGNLEHIETLTRQFGVEDIVEAAEPIPYRAALQEMLDADGLLIFQGAQFNTQIPAKVYEYFRARKPILGLVDALGETAQVLRAAGFDSLAAMDDCGEITSRLKLFLAQIREGQAHIAGEALIAASSRLGRTGELVRVFDRACAGKRGAPVSSVGTRQS